MKNFREMFITCLSNDILNDNQNIKNFFESLTSAACKSDKVCNCLVSILSNAKYLPSDQQDIIYKICSKTIFGVVGELAEVKREVPSESYNEKVQETLRFVLLIEKSMANIQKKPNNGYVRFLMGRTGGNGFISKAKQKLKGLEQKIIADKSSSNEFEMQEPEPEPNYAKLQ